MAGTNKRKVVITGVGALTPIGSNSATSWSAAIQGVSGVGKITRFDASQMSTTIAAEVKNFDPTPFIDQREIKKIDLFSQYGIAAASEAWTNAGLDGHRYSPNRSGCVMGVGIGGLTTLEKYHAAYLEGGPRKISPFLIPAMISNLSPGNIAIKYGLKGVNYVITSACTSATHALGEAYRMIADDLQDMVIAGGAESTVTPIGIGGFCALRALSSRNDQPERASRPFDKDRDGFVLGEGAAVLVLEEESMARARGAQILAEVVGYGFSCDAYHITGQLEDGAGAIACMQNALADAKLNPEQIHYINAHGTSTEMNDKTETLAIKKVFGDWAKKGLMVSSTKSMTGHLLGAAGAIEAFFSVMALKDGIIPPTINLDSPDLEAGCDLDYVPHQARQHKIQYALSNSFGFGGTNATLIFKRV
ncbi:MAG TPA: beta-ketoacyl-ACP synthase II [Oligoflexia bacterium]|nr:beta-ketoacyl-ACP synthase II [Oligoflexia bacterium]HMP27365.1 beta-ketoacyl-ACP synthase II [Oligoflexia bacterium]